MFVNLLGLEGKKETNYLIGTLWALAESPPAEIRAFVTEIPPQTLGKTPLSRKIFEWIRKKLQKVLLTDAHLARSYALFLFQAFSNLRKSADEEAKHIAEIFPLWIMYDNLQAHTMWQEIADPFQGAWIVHELLSFIFSKADLIHTYKISSFSALPTRRKWSWWLLYLGSHYMLQADNRRPLTSPPFKLPSLDEDISSPSSISAGS